MLLDGIRTIDAFRPAGKKILLRVDINSPVDRKSLEMESSAKINAATLTLNELLSKGAAVAILAHQGRPGDYDFISLKKHADLMAGSVKGRLEFVPDVCGEKAVSAIRGLKPGMALLLENVRQLDYEQKSRSPEVHSTTELVKALSPLFDYFVNDAFGAIHRAHCSMVGFTATLPSAAGRLMERELSRLSPLLDSPMRPAVYMFGGKKFSDFLPVLKAVVGSREVDRVLLAGYLAISFLMASGVQVDRGTREDIEKEADSEFFSEARKLMESTGKLTLPADMAFEIDGRRVEKRVAEWPEDARALDIGRQTIEGYTREISTAGTVFLSGPPGVYENELFAEGTRSVLEASSRPGIYSVIGGGHTSAAAQELGFADKVSYVSTGGGALEALISGKELAVLESLKASAEKFAGKFD